MGFRFGKSIKLGGGVRLNVSKKGIGASVGVKGLRVGVGPKGTRVTASIPGTGLSYQKQYGRSSRSAERKRQELMYKQQQKMAALEQARYEVEVFENRIDVLTSVHKECGPVWDWETIARSTPPFAFGSEVGPREALATAALQAYTPGFFDKLFRRVEKKRAGLEADIETARLQDQKEYEDWKELYDTAGKIVQGDVQTYIDVINTLSPFEDIAALGSTFEIKVRKDRAEVTLKVHSHDVLPAESKSLTKTGKLSTKPMPKTRYFELYQDYVCSCVLRFAREMFALLPLENVYVHAVGDNLNSATGQEEETTILSVQFPRATLESLNFDYIDCSDSMSNFVHNMKFKKTKGFEPVQQLSWEE